MDLHQFGGTDVSVVVSPPLPSGIPAYRGIDPGEWTFITKIVAGAAAPAGTQIDHRRPGHV